MLHALLFLLSLLTLKELSQISSSSLIALNLSSHSIQAIFHHCDNILCFRRMCAPSGLVCLLVSVSCVAKAGGRGTRVSASLQTIAKDAR